MGKWVHYTVAARLSVPLAKGMEPIRIIPGMAEEGSPETLVYLKAGIRYRSPGADLEQVQHIPYLTTLIVKRS